jgi:hypothetical protein
MIRYIYTFFVGLFLAIFIGMGIAVFYPAPLSPEPPPYYGQTMTDSEKKAQSDFEVKQKAYDKELWRYNRNASVIILSCAVIVLAISLSFADKIGIIADGLLLGGIFTLLYGVGRGMATDSNKYRFLIATIGLTVTLVLGYLKFTRHPLTDPKK